MNPEKLLLIDTERELSEQLSKGLGNHLQVAWSPTAAEGLRKAHDWRPRIVLIDVDLPDNNGFALFSALKKDKRTADCKYVIIGRNVDPVIFEKHKRLRRHADAYLHKPIGVDSLRGLLADQFGLTLGKAAKNGGAAKKPAKKDAPKGAANGSEHGDEAFLNELDNLLLAEPEPTKRPIEEDEVDLSELDQLLGVDETPRAAIQAADVPPPPPPPVEPEKEAPSAAMETAAAAEEAETAPETEILSEITPPPLPLGQAANESKSAPADELEEAVAFAEDELLDEELSAEKEATPADDLDISVSADEALLGDIADEGRAEPAVAASGKTETLAPDLSFEEAAEAEKTAAPPAALPAEIEALRREKDGLGDRVAQLSAGLKRAEEVARLKSEEGAAALRRANDLERSLAEREAEFDRLKVRHEQDLATQKERHAADAARLDAELTKAREVLKEKQTSEGEQVQRLSAELDALRRGTDEERQAARAEIDRLLSNLAEMEQSSNAVKSERDRFDAEARSAQLRVQELENELARAAVIHEEALGNLREELSLRHEKQIAALSQQNAELASRIDLLNNETTQLKEAAEAAKRKLSSLESDLRAAMAEAGRVGELEEEIARLTQQSLKNEARVIKAYRKIKEDTERQARSEKALSLALGIIRGQQKSK
ncbi:MAG: response regulator [Myxococcales bacterium]|nr:MAG: response regulator [Myxococcales bacterium]